MERRFAARRDQLLADAEVDPRIPRGVPARLECFLEPFVERLQRSEQGGHARSYVAGLVSELESKNVESIAYRHDREQEPLQQFIGQSPWDHRPWLAELARQVGRELGDPDGVLVIDPSAFPKKKGPVEVQAVWTLVQARIEGRASDVAEVLVVFRERQGDGAWKHDYLLSNAPLTTPVAEYARVFKAEHRIEECLQRAKGEAGLADYEVRTWRGWHHHQALALVATWFLTVEARRGKKMDAGVDGAAVAEADRGGVAAAVGNGAVGVHASHREPALTPD